MESDHPGVRNALDRLIQIEKDLLQIMRAGGRSSVYEAHSFVRRAIEALSQEPDPKARQE
jgi:hypothetical protein